MFLGYICFFFFLILVRMLRFKGFKVDLREEFFGF